MMHKKPEEKTYSVLPTYFHEKSIGENPVKNLHSVAGSSVLLLRLLDFILRLSARPVILCLCMRVREALLSSTVERECTTYSYTYYIKQQLLHALKSKVQTLFQRQTALYILTSLHLYNVFCNI